MKRLLLIGVTVLATGCATNQKFVAKMDNFIGRSESAVVGTYGPPGNSYTMADGSKVIQYTRGGQMILPGATTYQPVRSNTTGNVIVNQGMQQTTGTYTQSTTTLVPQQGPSTMLNLWCTVNFTIDKGGIVQAWNADGNRCVAD